MLLGKVATKHKTHFPAIIALWSQNNCPIPRLTFLETLPWRTPSSHNFATFPTFPKLQDSIPSCNPFNANVQCSLSLCIWRLKALSTDRPHRGVVCTFCCLEVYQVSLAIWLSPPAVGSKPNAIPRRAGVKSHRQPPPFGDYPTPVSCQTICHFPTSKYGSITSWWQFLT